MNKQQYNFKDISWIVLTATLILAFSSIPNWVGYSAQTNQLAYRGIFFDPQDYAVHISMMRAGIQGEWAYQFRYTTEAHLKAYTRLFYIVLGHANRFFQLDPASLFEIARWVFGWLALFTIYALTQRVFKEILWQRVAFLLAVFGSGLGWLQLMFGWIPGPITPIDFWLIDAYVFFGITMFPHFALVTAALCLAFILFFDFLEEGGWLRITGVAIIAILTQFVNPIAFVLVNIGLATATLAVWIQNGKIDWYQFSALGVIGVMQFPLLVYNFNLLSNDPIWSQFTLQNQTLSPPLIYYLWGFGLLWLFSLIGLFSAVRQQNPKLLSAAAWIFAGLVLAYMPFAIQRRFLHGVTIPLAILCTQGIRDTIQIISKKSPAFARRRSIIAILFVFFISISSIYLSLGRSLYLINRPNEFFYPTSFNFALVWLDNNAAPNDFVLSSVTSGQLITQKTNMRVYLGHEMETLDFDTKSQLVSAFFQGQADPGWLENTKVSWVLYGPFERALTGDSNFQDSELDVVYRSAEIIIYRVER